MKLVYNQKDEKNHFNKLIKISNDEFNEDEEPLFFKTFPKIILKIFFKLNDEDIENAVRGLGSNDEGLDAFFIDEEKETYFLIQFKSRKTYDENKNKDADKNWFALLDKITDKFNDLNFSSKNTRIMEIKNKINEEFINYKSEKIIFHLGFCSDEILNNNPNINYYNQTDILNQFVQFWESTLDNDSQIEELKISIESPNFKKFNNEHNFIFFTPKAIQGNTRKTIVITLNGNQVIDLLSQGTTIFNRNIRGFLGENEDVNKQIIQTAVNSPTEFYYYNNGITLTCHQFSTNSLNNKNPIINLTHPQIINGAQTVNSIYSAYKKILKSNEKNLKNYNEALEKTRNHFEDIIIICKIIESNKGEATMLTQNITRYSNHQNKIKFSDFYSNRPEQKRLQEIFKEKNISYEIKRGFTLKKNKDIPIISMEHLAEHHYAQNINPFKAKISEIFSSDFNEDKTESIYFQIFNNKVSYINDNKISFLMTYHIYSLTNKYFKEIKNTVKKIEELKINSLDKKHEIVSNFLQNLNNPTNNFYALTNSRNFVEDYLINESETNSKNLILKFLDIMELKVIAYIVNQLVKKSYFRRNSDNKIIRINDIFVKKIKNDELDSINKILIKLIYSSLNIYGKILNKFNQKHNTEFHSSLTFRKTNNNILDFLNYINEHIEDITEDNYISYDFDI